MSKDKVEILVGVDDKFRRWCDDFGDRSGCGQEVKIIEHNGKKTAYDPVEAPCLVYNVETKSYDRVWAFVPHYWSCPEQKAGTIQFMQNKAEERAAYKAKQNNGGGARRASY